MSRDASSFEGGAPYPSSRAEDLILRDHLAIDRTVLANERTLLAYVRTALTLFLVGVSFLHLPGLDFEIRFGGLVYRLGGWLFVAAAAFVLVVGYRRYRSFRVRIRLAQQGSGGGI